MGMALSRLSKIKDDDGNSIAQYSYDELSRRTLLTLGNDANVVYEYDLNNRLTKLTNYLDDTNSIIFDYSNYDDVGNRLSMKIDNANAHVYAYDNLYDSLGNRTSVTGGGTATYQRNCFNQYTSVDSNSFSYDKNGNLTDDGTYEYYYDCENRLIDVNEAGQTVASYKYDYLGRRVRKIVDGNTTKFCYDGGQVIAEYDGSDNPLRKFVYGPGIDEPICMIDVADNNAVYYYHFDGLGSVTALTDANCAVVEKYEYDVFGETTIKDACDNVMTESAVGNPYGFTGRRLDTETDNYYYRARCYKSGIGRFLQVDPLRTIPDKFILIPFDLPRTYINTMNLYSYAGNNPIIFTDPLGLVGKYVGGEGHFFVGYGRTVVSCKDEDGCSHKFLFKKWCFGGAIGGSVGGGLVRGVSGRKCKPSSYEKWFYEAGAAAGIGIAGAGVGVDVGYDDSNWGLPGNWSGTAEVGVHSGYGVKVKSTWCKYKFLREIQN